MNLQGRKVEDLLKKKETAYIYFEDLSVVQQFAAQAEAEGFVAEDGSKIRQNEFASVVIVSKDKKIRYANDIDYESFTGVKPIFRVDWKKYISGDKEFIYDNKKR